MVNEPVNPDISDMPPPRDPTTPESTSIQPKPTPKQENGYFPPKPISKLNNKKIVLISIISLVTTALLITYVVSRNALTSTKEADQNESNTPVKKSTLRIIMEELGLSVPKPETSTTTDDNSGPSTSTIPKTPIPSTINTSPTPTPSSPSSTPTPTSTPESGSLITYNIDAFNFGYSLSNITASAGDTVRITLSNSGGNHNFVISEISGASTSIITQGEQVTIEFTIPVNPASSYAFFCSVGNHRAQGMEGTLTIN